MIPAVGVARSVPLTPALRHRLDAPIDAPPPVGPRLAGTGSAVAVALVSRRVARALAALCLACGALGAVAVATGWLRPVVTHGSSMQPTYAAGDLVLVAGGGEVGIGDVAAYRDPGSGSVVLHRVVGGDPDSGYLLRGDSNGSLDPHRPTGAEILGTPVLHVPRVGLVVGSTGGLVGALVALACAGLALVGATQRPAGRSDRATPRATPRLPHRSPTGEPAQSPGGGGRTLARAAVAGLVVVDVALAAALAAALAFPPTAVEAALPTQTVSLAYRAEAPVGATYPDGTVSTGDPAFLRLVDALEVRFTHDLDTGTVPPAGTLRVRAELRATGGWHRVVPLAEAALATTRTELHATLELRELLDALVAMSVETGVPTSGGALTLTGEVIPVGGAERTATPLGASLGFALSEQGLTPTGAVDVVEHAGLPSVVASGPALAPAPTVHEGGIPREWRRSLLLALLTGVTLTALAWPTERPRARVVAVREARFSPELTRIRMDDPASLAEIAEQEHTPLLEGAGWRAVVVHHHLYWDGEREPSSVG